MVDSVTKILKNQHSLETKYQQLIQEQQGLKELPNKSLYKQGQSAIFDVNNEIQASTQGEFLN